MSVSSFVGVFVGGIVVINVSNKIKNVKNAFFYPKNKKNVKTFVNVIKNVTLFLLAFLV